MAKTFPNHEKWVQTWYKQFADDWEFLFWDVDMIRSLFSRYSNGGDLWSAFLLLPNKAAQSDLARYVIVYTYGGMYVDTDMECVRKFDMLLNEEDKDIYVSLNTDLNTMEKQYCSPVNNHWFYCPNPTFTGLWSMIESISFLASNNTSAKNTKWTLDVTGPMAFLKMVHQHRTGYISWHLVEAKSLPNCELRYSYKTEEFPCAYAIHHLAQTWVSESEMFRRVLYKTYGFTRKNSVPIIIGCIIIISVLAFAVTLLATGILPSAGGNYSKAKPQPQLK